MALPLAGGGTGWNLAQGLGTGRSDAFQAGVYGKSYWGPAYVAAALAFTNNWFTTDRTAMGDELTANFAGQTYGARLETGYRYRVPVGGGAIGATPYAAIQSQWFHTPTFGETDLSGGGLGLTFNSMTANDTRSELGARLEDPTLLNGMPLILRARLAWAHDWVTNPALDALFQSLPGSGFIVNGATPPANSALVSAGAQYFLASAWSFTAKFDGEFASGSQTYGGTGTLRYTW
jgi:outer membrane autotransporter protein